LSPPLRQLLAEKLRLNPDQGCRDGGQSHRHVDQYQEQRVERVLYHHFSCNRVQAPARAVPLENDARGPSCCGSHVVRRDGSLHRVKPPPTRLEVVLKLAPIRPREAGAARSSHGRFICSPVPAVCLAICLGERRDVGDDDVE
jgi:hypothetical protein